MDLEIIDKNNNKTCRHYTWTGFDNVEWKKQDWYKLFVVNPDILFLCLGLETCPKTGKKHWQGYVELNGAHRYTKLKKILKQPNSWYKSSKGNAKSNATYTSKEGTWWFFGDPSLGQGKDRNLGKIHKLLKDGKNLDDIAYNQADLFPVICRNINALKWFQQVCERKNRLARRDVKIYLISGGTDKGKTTSIMNKFGDAKVFKIQGDQLKWFDGYNGEKILLIDEYNNDVSCTTMLGYLDQFNVRLPIKGGFTYANWDKVIITTNLKLHEVHKSAKPEHRRAFFKRCKNGCIIDLYKHFENKAEKGAKALVATLPLKSNLVTKCHEGRGNRDALPKYYTFDEFISVDEKYKYTDEDLYNKQPTCPEGALDVMLY